MALSFLCDPTLTSVHDYGKNHGFDDADFVDRVISLLLNTLSKFVIAFLPRSKRFLISWLQSSCTVILELKKISLSPFLVGRVLCKLLGVR